MNMANISINVDFSKDYSHQDLITELSHGFEARSGDSVNLQITLLDPKIFIYSDILVLVVAFIKHLKNNDVIVKGGLRVNHGNDNAKYASRVNFFKELGIEFDEPFERKEALGKFTEINEFNPTNIYQLQDQLNLILHNNADISREVRELLFYCLNEIMDNVLVHSGNKNGWICCQSFKQSKEIRLIICDNGVGIHNSLTKNPKSKYANLSEKESLAICIQKGVTNGEGLGFGLFATSRFIKENGGDILIYSGSHYLMNQGPEYPVSQGDRWMGTIVFLKINTNIAVDYRLIMPKEHSLPDDYQDFIDKNFGANNDLW
jgi:hypothetical protein